MVAHSGDGGKGDEAQGWARPQTCSPGNGVGEGDPAGWPHPQEKEEKEKEKEKQQQGGPAPSLLETISGEFALVISGHSLVSGTHQPLIGGLASTVSSTQERSKHDLQSTSD